MTTVPDDVGFFRSLELQWDRKREKDPSENGKPSHERPSTRFVRDSITSRLEAEGPVAMVVSFQAFVGRPLPEPRKPEHAHLVVVLEGASTYEYVTGVQLLILLASDCEQEALTRLLAFYCPDRIGIYNPVEYFLALRAENGCPKGVSCGYTGRRL